MTIADKILWRDPEIQLRNVTILKGCELLHLLGFLALIPVRSLDVASINPAKKVGRIKYMEYTTRKKTVKTYLEEGDSNLRSLLSYLEVVNNKLPYWDS